MFVYIFFGFKSYMYYFPAIVTYFGAIIFFNAPWKCKQWRL